MSNPRPESRISSLEKRASALEASIEELSSDTAEGLKDLKEDNKRLFEHVQLGFKQAHTYIKEDIETVLTDHTKRMDRIESKLDQILQLLQPKSPESK